MKIGILQTGHAVESLLPIHGDYDVFFRRLLDGHGFTFVTFRVVDGDFPGSIRDADGWLITGSRHGAYDDLPWIAPLEDFIRAAYAADVPMAGICFGHQIMAQALGGRVEKFHGGWTVGRTPYHYTDGRDLQLNAWHQDQVVTVPPEATVIASSPNCDNAAFIYKRRAWSVQPHPEFDAAFLADLIEARGRGVVPDALLDAAAAHTAEPLDNPAIADEIARFFKAR